jgi:hypothetical protein
MKKKSVIKKTHPVTTPKASGLQEIQYSPFNNNNNNKLST